MSSSSSSASGVANPNGPIRIVLGTMTIGPKVGNAHSDKSKNPLPAYCQTDPTVALAQLKAFVSSERTLNKSGPEAGKHMIDTASAYQNGWTEKVLGDILAANPDIRSKLSIHTKCNSGQLPHSSLSKASVLQQANESLKGLQIATIDIFYLHGPDINVPIDETLDAIDQLHKEKKIVEFGLSNYPAWKVVDIWYRCKQRGMVQPTVYQGCYNALTRSVEFEAAAAFRELGIRSYHYNPLAGGMLTGKYESFESSLKESGRFGSESPISGAMYSQRYWKTQYFEALDIVKAACEKEKIAMGEASLRWLLHHSVLSGNHHDGIIFGASSLTHCETNLKWIEGGPLPDSIVQAFDRAWEKTRFAATPYFRGYGTLSGNCDTFLLKFQPYVPKSAV